MEAQSSMMFSKLLTQTDIKKRLAIPSKTLPLLPAFNGSHAIRIHLMYGTRTWPIDCTVRKKAYKKPVFSGGLWRDFVIGNKLNVGDRISMYKVQGSHFRVEVLEKEKPAATSQHGALRKVTTRTFFDQVIAKPSVKIFGANMIDEKAQFNIEMKCSGCIRDAAVGGAMGYGTSDATGEACTDTKLSLDLVLRQPTP